MGLEHKLKIVLEKIEVAKKKSSFKGNKKFKNRKRPKNFSFKKHRKNVGAKECDIYDVLRYISFRKNMLKRSDRMLSSRELYYPSIDQPHQDFIDFVGHQYINRGVWELSQENLPKLIELRYETVADGINNLGEISLIKDVYDGFQKSLYEAEVA